jgi:hypothetical protein
MKKRIPILVFIVAALSFFGCSEIGVMYYTITFDGNGAEGDPPPAVSVPALQLVPIPGKEGLSVTADKVFKNWNTAPNGTGIFCNPGDKIQFTADTVLYAQWQNKAIGKDYKTFWAQDIGDNYNYNRYTVEAVERAAGNKCIIYADILADITDETITDIKDKYDAGIHGTIINAFGDYEDVDKNGKVILLLLDIKDGYVKGDSGGYVAGYFHSIHMYATTYSNHADMLFIDVNPGLDKLSQLYSTIAHELQHLVNYSQTALKGKSQKELWINEGLSTAAEYIYDPANTSRIDYFNDSNTLIDGDYGTIPYGNNFFVWNGYWEQEYGDVLADYATAYLFFRWLGIHGSHGIYKDIINNSSGNYLSVTAAAESRIPSLFAGLTPDTNEKRWETLLGAWMTANYYNSSTGIYGYENNVGGLDVLVLDDIDYLVFSPGEGVFSEQSGDPFSPGYDTGPNIRYWGLGGSQDSPVVDDSSSYTGGTDLLTFNVNTKTNGDDEIGYLAGIAGTGTGPALSALPAGLPVRAGSASADGKAYPVSFGDKAAGLDKPGKAAPRPRPGAR